MRRFLLSASIALAIAGAAEANPIANPPPIAGQLPAQPSNAAANVGSIGEQISAVSVGTSIAATITNATPAVVTMTANTFASSCQNSSGSKCALPVYFTGLAGTHGISNTTPYWVDPASISGSNFSIATSPANALAGTDVATTGTDSGTGIAAYYFAASATVEEGIAISIPGGSWNCQHVAAVTGVASTAPTLVAIGQNLNNTISVTATGTAQVNATLTTGAQTDILNGTQVVVPSSLLSVFFNVEETWTGGATNPTAKQRATCTRYQ